MFAQKSSPGLIRFELFSVHRRWISDYIFRRFRTVRVLRETKANEGSPCYGIW